MTALAQDRKTDKLGVDDSVYPLLLSFPVAASTKIYAGSMVAVNSSGYAVPASANNTLKVWGRCEKTVDNSAGNAGDLNVSVRPGAFYFNVGTGADAMTRASVGQYCYVIDDNTVGLTDGGGTRPLAGLVLKYGEDGTSLASTQAAVWLGGTSPYLANPEVNPSAGGTAFKARGVVFANVASLTAFTVASNDGITYVAGDTVLLTAQTTAKQNGPYVVGTVSSGTAPLTRPDWWATGNAIAQGSVIQVGGEGTIFGSSQWKATCAKGKIVDTDDPALYPDCCRATVTLSSGTYTLGSTEGLFLLSTTHSMVQATLNTAGGTLGTNRLAAPVASRTAGVSGTAAVVINSLVDAGTVASGDTSTIDVLVTNW